MPKHTRDEARRLYRELSDKNEMLYHIAHARKENTDRVYDGDALRQSFAEDLEDHLADYRAGVEFFRQKSVDRG